MPLRIVNHIKIKSLYQKSIAVDSFIYIEVHLTAITIIPKTLNFSSTTKKIKLNAYFLVQKQSAFIAIIGETKSVANL